MKPLRRRLFNFAAVLSGILCIATVVDRVAQQRYFHWFEVLTWRSNGSFYITHAISITAHRGDIFIAADSLADETAPKSHLNYGSIEDDTSPPTKNNTLLGRAGFGFSITRMVRGKISAGGYYAYYNGIWCVNRVVTIPTWFLATSFAVLPMAAALRRKRVAPGCCAKCSYDLRATPDRCPECGTERSILLPHGTP